MAWLARSAALPGSPLSAALAQAVGAQLPAGFDAELKADVAKNDFTRARLRRSAAALSRLGDLEGTELESGADTGATMIYGRAGHVLLATAGPKPNGEGVTLTWSGPKKTLPDGSSAPVWNGKVVDIRLSLAQAGWDVSQIGPLRYQVGKRSIEVRDAVVGALRGGLRLAGRPNEAIQPRKRNRRTTPNRRSCA